MAFFPDNAPDWEAIDSYIRKAGTIFISSHVNPDGDAIGSEMALAEFLTVMGKKVRVVNASTTPDSYRFLDPDSRIETNAGSSKPSSPPQAGDLVIVLDLGNYERLGDIRKFLIDTPASKIIIDHHFPEQVAGDVVVVNTSAASTGCLVFDLINYIDPAYITHRVALATLTAVVTDTGYFTYSNTTATTHRIAAALYERGVAARDIRKRLEYGQPFCRQKLLGLSLARVALSDCGRIGYTSITTEMFREAEARREHTDGIINQVRIIKDIKIASLFVQEGDYEYKVSFRSVSGIPVNTIAARLGGGGHEKAAGALLRGSLADVVKVVLDLAARELDALERR